MTAAVLSSAAPPSVPPFDAAGFAFASHDAGRLRVHRLFADLFRDNGLTTFDAFLAARPVEIARQVGERVTARLELCDGADTRAFYIKSHGRATAKEVVKCWLRLTRPVLGARPEWDAMLRLHAVGLPTMTPAALGECGGRSFVVTESLEGFERLDHWLADNPHRLSEQAELVAAVADFTRRLHGAGLHHQDLYLCHFLRPRGGGPIHLIDLGRVRSHRRLASRWIVKDLAQLLFSSDGLGRSGRLRFLRLYLGRRLRRGDRRLIRRVERKATAIARHSHKNGL